MFIHCKKRFNEQQGFSKKHFLEEYYIELDLIRKLELEEGNELSDKFVPVEDREETNTIEVSKPNDDNETNTVVETDERNDDDRMNATVVNERNNDNKKEREQSEHRLIIIGD